MSVLTGLKHAIGVRYTALMGVPIGMPKTIKADD